MPLVLSEMLSILQKHQEWRPVLFKITFTLQSTQSLMETKFRPWHKLGSSYCCAVRRMVVFKDYISSALENIQEYCPCSELLSILANGDTVEQTSQGHFQTWKEKSSGGKSLLGVPQVHCKSDNELFLLLYSVEDSYSNVTLFFLGFLIIQCQMVQV